MTRHDYTAYQEAVENFFVREGLANLSTVSDEGRDSCEAYFTWAPCDCCGRNLGGDRYDCSGYNETTQEVQTGYSVYVDCVYYAEYGRLDDQTMMEMEKNRERD